MKAAPRACLYALMLLGLCGSGPGCGYRIGRLLPADIQTVAVPMFRNFTEEPNIEARVTEAVIRRIQWDGTLRVVNEERADTLLEADLVEYRRVPAVFDQGATVGQYRLILGAKIRLSDLRSGKTVLQVPLVQGETIYLVGSDMKSSEEAALPAAADDLARHIVDTVVEMW